MSKPSLCSSTPPLPVFRKIQITNWHQLEAPTPGATTLDSGWRNHKPPLARPYDSKARPISRLHFY